MTNEPNVSTELPQAADRTEAFRLISDGVAKGLPIPLCTYLHGHQSMGLRFDDNDSDAADRWAEFLNLPRPERRDPVHDLDSDRPWKSYKSADFAALRGVAGWTASIWCLVTATDAEIAAARAAAEVTR